MESGLHMDDIIDAMEPCIITMTGETTFTDDSE